MRYPNLCVHCDIEGIGHIPSDEPWVCEECKETQTPGVRTVHNINWLDQPCYYVSVIDYWNQDGKPNRFGLLVGPFKTHREALEMVDRAREEAKKHNDRAIWYAYGTCKMPDGHHKGILNEFLGINND